MRELLTDSVRLSEAKMMTEDCKCAYIWVEGCSDIIFYNEALCKKYNCYFRQLDGWENVIRVIKLANDQRLRRTAAIIDRDFHQLLEDGILNTSNLFATDKNDIEMVLLFSSAYDKFLRLCASEVKMRAIDDSRELILSAASPLGALRLISLQEKLNLYFEGLDLSDFISKATLKVDSAKMVAKVFQRTRAEGGNPTSDITELQDRLACALEKYSSEDLCNGHDVFDVLKIAMTKVFASYNSKDYDSDKIFSYLLMGYTAEDFEQTKLYVLLQEWFEANQLQRI